MGNTSWVFFRAYLFIALLVIVTGLSLEFLLERQDHEAAQRKYEITLRGSFLFAEQQFFSSGNENPKTYEKFLGEQLEIPAVLHALSDFKNLGAQWQGLQLGSIVVLYDDNDRAIFYRRLKETNWILALGPLPERDGERAAWIVPLFYSLLALAVFLWIRPLSRDLEGLQQSARTFGRQDFSARVKIPASSWLAPLGQAFNSMAQRIQRLLQSHRDLTHAVSHELRTPLARLRFSLEMLEGAEHTDRERHCASMRADVEELNSLIEEMLGYAELDQQNLEPKRKSLAVSAWLASYVDSYSTGASNISLKLGQLSLEGKQISVDHRMFSRALDNLVSNALRYAKNSIELSAHSHEGFCRLCVRDDGPGIPVAMRDTVLEAYNRLESDDGEARRGFGLGLAIVKRIMELHGGAITIETAPGGGADIYLDWPY